jgi:hypothetical protein
MERKRKKSIKNDEIETKIKKTIEIFNNDKLPTEILLKIFGYLPLKDLCKAAR